jgi:hypothetical protein
MHARKRTFGPVTSLRYTRDSLHAARKKEP